MAKKIHHFKGFSIITDAVEIKVSMKRIEDNFNKAQYGLDSAIMLSMIPFMPKQTGQFINVTQAMSQSLAGSGIVVAAAPPQGRYLYEGKKMVDSQTGKGPAKITTGPGEYVLRFRKGAKLTATNQPLKYTKSANPSAQDHWFEPAKEKDGKEWVKTVKKIAGGD